MRLVLVHFLMIPVIMHNSAHGTEAQALEESGQEGQNSEQEGSEEGGGEGGSEQGQKAAGGAVSSG